MKTKVGDSIWICFSGGDGVGPMIWRPIPPLIVEKINPDGTVQAADGYFRAIRTWIRVSSAPTPAQAVKSPPTPIGLAA